MRPLLALLLAAPLLGADFPPIEVPRMNATSRPQGGWVSINAATKAARNTVANIGVSIEMVEPGSVRGFATAEEVAELKKRGFTVEHDIRPLDFPTEDSAYHNYQELLTEIGGIAGMAPELVSVFPIGKSLEGRSLLAIRLNTTAKGNAPSSKPGIVFLGTHHAREHLSTETPLLIAKYIVDNREKPEIKRLLASRDVYFIPMVNPDGVEYDIEGDRYHMHRKNMRKNGDGTTGVDLNRNYSWGWGGGGSSGSPGSDTYRGTSAFSEPETQAVRDFVTSRKNLKILLSYHTFSELILYPWGGTDDPIQDTRALSAFKAMAGKMAEWTGYKPQQSSDLYIATGDTCDWAWGELGIFAFTFELTPKSMWSGGGFYPGAAAIQKTVAANIKPALYLIDLADDPYRAAQPAAGAAR
jgi:carboxypeptidase T